MSFTINGKIYCIYNVLQITGKKSYVGQSTYDEGMILIEVGDIEQMLITLKHELMHVWLFENGHKNQKGDEIFSYEDLCEYSALAHDSIERIYREYKKRVL